MTNPDGMKFCRVEGRFRAFVADGTDAGEEPDFRPMVGTITFTANIINARNVNVGVEEMYFPQPITVSLDSDGDLSLNGTKGVSLLCPSEAIRPDDWNWTATFRVTLPDGTRVRNFGPFPFDVVPDGTVNLAAVLPVPAANGTWALIGPAGPAGADSTVPGPQGPEGPEGPQGPAGEPGEPGPAGADGAPGVDGVDGVNGTNGTNGADGAVGPEGPVGPVGPAGADGADGVDGVDGAIGPAGPAGADGAIGPEGPQGPVGPEGPTVDGNMVYHDQWSSPPGRVYTFESGVIPEDWIVPAGSEIVDRVNAELGTTKALKIGNTFRPDGYAEIIVGPVLGPGTVKVDYWISETGITGYYDFDILIDSNYESYSAEYGQQSLDFLITDETGQQLGFGHYYDYGGPTPPEVYVERVELPDPSVVSENPYGPGAVVTHDGVDYITHTVPAPLIAPADSADWHALNEPLPRGNMVYRDTWYTSLAETHTWQPDSEEIPDWMTVFGTPTPTFTASYDADSAQLKGLQLGPAATAGDTVGVRFTVVAPAKIQFRYRVDQTPGDYYSDEMVVRVTGGPEGTNQTSSSRFDQMTEPGAIYRWGGLVIPGTGTRTVEIGCDRNTGTATPSWLGVVRWTDGSTSYGADMPMYEYGDVVLALNESGQFGLYSLLTNDDALEPRFSRSWKPVGGLNFKQTRDDSFTAHGHPQAINPLLNVQFPWGNTNSSPGIYVRHLNGQGGNPAGVDVDLYTTNYLARFRNNGFTQLTVDQNGVLSTLGGEDSHITTATTSPEGVVLTDYGLVVGRASAGVGPGRVWHKTWNTGNVTGWAPIAASTAYSTKTANYTLGVADELVIFNGTSLTATLPDPGSLPSTGRIYRIKNINASALTVSPGAGKTIDGAANKSLAQWADVTVTSNGSQWLILGTPAAAAGGSTPAHALSIIFGG